MRRRTRDAADGETPSTHGETPSTHGETPSTHGETPTRTVRRRTRTPTARRRARTRTRRDPARTPTPMRRRRRRARRPRHRPHRVRRPRRARLQWADDAGVPRSVDRRPAQLDPHARGRRAARTVRRAARSTARSHENHFKTVDVTTLTPIGNGQATPRRPGRHGPRQRDDGHLRQQRRPDALPGDDHRAVPEHLTGSRVVRDERPAARRRRTVAPASSTTTRRIRATTAATPAGTSSSPGSAGTTCSRRRAGSTGTSTRSWRARWPPGRTPTPTSRCDVDLVVTRHGGVPADAVLRRGRHHVVQQVPDRVTVQVTLLGRRRQPDPVRPRCTSTTSPGQSYQAQPPTAAERAQLAGSAQ